MSFPEFGRIVQPKAQEGSFEEFGTKVQDTSRFQSLLNAPFKGLLKGSRELYLGGGAKEGEKENLPKQLIKKIIGKSKEETLFRPQEEFEKEVDVELPTKDLFAERALERGGKGLPFAALGGPAAILRQMGGAVVGEAIKSAGGDDLAQAAGELFSLSIPSLSKKILANGGQKPIVDFARKFGLSEEKIAPLIQGDKKVELLSKLGKGKKAQKAVEKSKSAISGIYEDLKASPEAAKRLSNEHATSFLHEMHDEIAKLPSGARDLVMKDIIDFTKDMTGKGLIKLYQDVNYYMGKGNKLLGGLHNPIKNAMTNLSPKLGEDFGMTNQLWKNMSKISAKVQPGKYEELMNYGRKGRVIYGVISGNYPVLVEALGEEAAKSLSRNMLINPRFQNISKQMVDAVNKSKFSAAEKLLNQITKESNPENPTKFQE